eukprot:1159708-Pelagomonas_calceolata.AAC.5
MECGAHARAKELWGGGPVTDEPPEEGTVHKAVVKRIEPYGVVGAAAAAADDDGNDESMAVCAAARLPQVWACAQQPGERALLVRVHAHRSSQTKVEL